MPDWLESVSHAPIKNDSSAFWSCATSDQAATHRKSDQRPVYRGPTGPVTFATPRVAYVFWNGGFWWARFGDADSYIKGTSPQTLRAQGYKVIIED